MIFAMAILLNVALLFVYHWPQSKGLAGDEHGYTTRAFQIAHNESVHKSPIWPPGYDYFLSLPLSVAEALNFSKPLLFPQIIQVALWILGGVFFWKITLPLLQSYSIRSMSLSIYMLNPTLIAYTHYFWPEIPHLTIYLFALWIIICRSSSNGWNGVVGALLAIAALLKLVYLPVSIVLMALMFFVRYFRHERLTPAIVSIILFVSVLSPTLLDNLKVHDKFMVADSGTFNLWVGLNDKSLTDWHPDAIVGRELNAYLKSAKIHNDRNTIYQKKIKEFVGERGVVQILSNQLSKQYYRLFDHRTFFTKQLQGGMKEKYSSSSTMLSGALRIWNNLIWVVTLFGLGVGFCVVLLSKKLHSGVYLLSGIIAYNLLIFLFLHVKTRYVIQFLPMITIISSIGLYKLQVFYTGTQSVFTVRRSSLELITIIIGSLLSCLLLFLAFRNVLI